MKVKVAVLQYEVPEDANQAFNKLAEMVSQASWSGAKLVVTPETALGELSKVEEAGDAHREEMVKIAKASGVYLCTSYYNYENNKIYNQGLIISPEGKVIVSHKKIYLAGSEIDDGVVHGNEIKVENTEVGKLGMIICKDGFNKYSCSLYDKFAELGAEIICVPSWSLSWKELDTQEYIKSLYTFGAFQSRSFVLVSGNLNVSTKSFGRSLIISPVKGVIREGSADHKEVIIEELDLDEVKKAREFDLHWQPKEKIII
jgi:predicted amidohydrolase